MSKLFLSWSMSKFNSTCSPSPRSPRWPVFCVRVFLYSYGNVCLVASSQGPNVTTQQYFALVARSNLLSPAWRRVFAHPVHARSKFLLFCAQMMFVIFACSSFACAKPVPGFLYNIYFRFIFYKGLESWHRSK